MRWCRRHLVQVLDHMLTQELRHLTRRYLKQQIHGMHVRNMESPQHDTPLRREVTATKLITVAETDVAVAEEKSNIKKLVMSLLHY